MSRLATFRLDDGRSFVAEVDDEIEIRNTMRGASTNEEMIVQSSQAFETAFDNIKKAAESMVARLCSLADPPDELAIEFGVKLSAETGALIAKAATEANFSITLKWKRALAEVK
jgi:Trypsin-co-occurring domain 1